MSAEVETVVEDQTIEPIMEDAFFAKCMSKCSQYRSEANKEKAKRQDFRSEIREEFGNTAVVESAIASLDNRREPSAVVGRGEDDATGLPIPQSQ